MLLHISQREAKNGVAKNLHIYAGEKGNLARNINHSCDPNLSTYKWYGADQTVHICYFANQRIDSYEELTADYQWGYDSKLKNATQCLCG